MNLKQQRFALITCLALSMLLHLLYGLEGIRQFKELDRLIKKQQEELMDKQEKIDVLEMLLENREKDASNLKHLGTFTATFYCTCELCCGKTPEHPAYGITKSGTKVEEGRTIAVDPKVIPLGSEVIVDGNKYIAEDTGRLIKGNRIDIYISEHSRALELGRVNKEVYLVN